MSRRGLFLLALLVGVLSCPPQWYPMPVRLKLTEWFGASGYRGLPSSLAVSATEPSTFCPPDPSGWRQRQSIEGVEIGESASCVADNPYAVAAFVRGTNNIDQNTLLESGLTADAVTKGRDLDGDGDPDEIHIRLEVAELNGSSGVVSGPVTQYEIAPGIKPGMW
ncbi:MAG: copper oxidase, partial [Xanthomonadales bacterium]|nr:copper oxidase [Xanthomonadales bacterium]